MIIGPEELKRLPFLANERFDVPTVPFSEDALRAREKTHILVLAPRVRELTIVGMRELFGVDPEKSEPCMYNQDWYLKEDFANTPPDGKWHLVRKEVLQETRAKNPDDIHTLLRNEIFPSAVTAAFTFFAWRILFRETLWKHDFLWCSDTDHNGDRIYVGRYEDPDGVSKNGFNIHRHLSLRPVYGAAPEVVG